MSGARAIAVFLAILLSSVPTFSRGTKETLESIRQQLRLLKREAREKEREERTLYRKLREVSAEAGRLQGQLRVLQDRYEKLEDQIEDLRREVRNLEGKIEQLKGKVSRRLVALLELQRGGLFPLILGSSSYAEMLMRTKILSEILKKDRETLEQLCDLLSRYRERLNELTELQQQLAREAYKLQSLRKGLVKKRSEVKRLLSRVRRERRKELQRIAQLERRKKALEELIVNLRGKGTPSILSRLKGRFPFPVEGTLGRLPHYEGVAIYCRRGAEVRSVADGRVVFASWFEGYGNLMIIEHGMGYHTVYARLGKMLKGPGEKVRSGEVIALAGPGPEGKGMIYFEVRHNGRCEPPRKWLALPIAE